jgi:hypothetical protein
MRRFPIGSSLVLSAVLGACASSPHRVRGAKPANADGENAPAKTVAQLMARENGPFKKHHVALFGGW